MRKIIYVLITIITFSCHAPDCNTLPNTFKSYDEAISLVKGSKFEISESANILGSASSWVKAAHYYSCHGQIGYFIIEIDRKTYIHANMPVAVWLQFKNAGSFGAFYNDKIKEKYKLELNEH